MVLTLERDGRISALVIRDLASSLIWKLERAVTYQLTGSAGGTWRIERGEPAALLVMDALDCHLLAAGRLSVGEAVPPRRLMEMPSWRAPCWNESWSPLSPHVAGAAGPCSRPAHTVT